MRQGQGGKGRNRGGASAAHVTFLQCSAEELEHHNPSVSYPRPLLFRPPSTLQHSAEEFERLLREFCADDDGDLLIDSAVKGGPRLFLVSTLVTVSPAAMFLFRNYQVRARPCSACIR